MPHFHWMTVGHVSQAAETAINTAGGTVVHLVRDSPSLVIVALPYRRISEGFRDLYIGGREEIFIKVPSLGLHLTWSSEVDGQDHVGQVSVDKTVLRTAEECHSNWRRMCLA